MESSKKKTPNYVEIKLYDYHFQARRKQNEWTKSSVIRFMSESPVSNIINGNERIPLTQFSIATNYCQPNSPHPVRLKFHDAQKLMQFKKPNAQKEKR